MIQVEGFDHAFDTNSVYWIGASSSDGWAYCYLRDFKRTTHDYGRSKFDFLNQGKAFDRFNNKRLGTRHSDVLITQAPRYQDGSSGSSSTRGTVLSDPLPTVYIQGKWYDLGNYGYHIHEYTTFGNRWEKYLYYSWIDHADYRDRACIFNAGIRLTLQGSRDSNVCYYSNRSINNYDTLSGLESYSDLRMTVSNLVHTRMQGVKHIGFNPAEWLPHIRDILALYAYWLKNALIKDMREGRRSGGSFYKTTTKPFAEDPVLDKDKIESLIKTSINLSCGITFTDTEKSIQARQVIEDINDFDSNMLAYVSDFKKSGDTIRELLHLAGNWKSPKAWASAWLSGRYGDRLAVKDTQELLSSIQRAISTRSQYAIGKNRFSDSQTSSDGNLTITRERLAVTYVAPDSYSGIMTAVNNLMKWDVWPTLENTWDLIPLSFLVDWILPVSDLLSQIDAAVQAPYLKPISQYVGEKIITRWSLPESTGLLGTITTTYYSRRPHDVLGDVRPFDVVADLPSFSVVHLADAVAILVQTR